MKDYTHIPAIILNVSEQAVLADVGDENKWIPRSVIEDGQYIEAGDAEDLNVEEWWAVQAGLV